MKNNINTTLDDILSKDIHLYIGQTLNLNANPLKAYLYGTKRVFISSISQLDKNNWGINYIDSKYSVGTFSGPREEILTLFYMNKLKTKAAKVLYGR